MIASRFSTIARSRAREGWYRADTPIAKRVEEEHRGRGWATFTVVGLMLGSALGVGLVVGWRGQQRARAKRDYGSEEKWGVIRYANVVDMEKVSASFHFISF